VTAKGVLLARHKGPVEPRDANGIMLRLNNVGIGSYQLFGLVGQATIRQRLTGEVHILHGLHDALNTARDRFSGPAFDHLKAFLLNALQELASEADTHWQETGKKKKEKRQEDLKEKHKAAHKKQQKKTPDTTKVAGGGGASDGATKKAAPAKPRPPDTAETPTKPEPSDPDQKAHEPTTEETPAFSDPVANVRHGAGEITFNESHELFKIYKGIREMETRKAALRAMKIAEVPKDVYERVIEVLLSFK
jgi:hypothetical protein